MFQCRIPKVWDLIPAPPLTTFMENDSFCTIPFSPPKAGDSRLTIIELLQTLHERSCLKITANRKDSSGVRDGYCYSGGAYFPPFDQWLMLPHILESNRTIYLFK